MFTRAQVAAIAALARLDMLDAAGARRLAVFAEGPSAAMRERAGPRLLERLPTDAEVADYLATCRGYRAA